MNAAVQDLARIRAAGAALIEAPQPLPPELLPVEPFPLAALPDAFSPWVRDVSERMHCPPDFVAVPLLVDAASLVARNVGIRPQQRTDWIERGNLWALIVGRPGIMKSPAMSQALAQMDRLEARAAEAFNAMRPKSKPVAHHCETSSAIRSNVVSPMLRARSTSSKACENA